MNIKPQSTTHTPATLASMRRTTDQLCVRSASLRGLAVNDKDNAGTLHDAADLLYDAAQELGYLRNRDHAFEQLLQAAKWAYQLEHEGQAPAGLEQALKAAITQAEPFTH